MLVIRRHPGESILIGGEIEIEIIDCGHNRVKLGIRAPQHIPVMRAEVRLTREHNLAAARSIPGRRGEGLPVVPLLGGPAA
jgi:carbon storage regulator